MSEAKKADEKISTSTTPKRGRKVGRSNPLHEGVTGPGLLVDLMTERAIEKCDLQENWEVPGGWEYEDLRAIAACALGESYATEQDRERAAVVEGRTRKAVIKEIREKATPPLNHEDDSGHTPLPEYYCTTLILGLFDSTNPLPGKKTEKAEMREEFAKFTGVEEKMINDRPFEHPKRVVMKRFQNHLKRQEKRDAFHSRKPSSVEEGCGPQGALTSDQVFQLVCHQLAQKGLPGNSLSPERQKEIASFLMRKGLKPSSGG
jgi:hypothetical protein